MYKPGQVAIIWGDIETTGLSHINDVILEVGLRATDWWGTEIARITWPVLDHNWEEKLAGNDFVLNMHTESGLLGELRVFKETPLGFRPDAVDQKLRTWLSQFDGRGPHDGLFPFAGNSVHFDRLMLRSCGMPMVDGWFSYRNLDISAIREACKLVNPALHAKIPQAPAAHRPQGDIDNSITLWQFYIDNFFFEGEE